MKCLDVAQMTDTLHCCRIQHFFSDFGMNKNLHATSDPQWCKVFTFAVVLGHSCNHFLVEFSNHAFVWHFCLCWWLDICVTHRFPRRWSCNAFFCWQHDKLMKNSFSSWKISKLLTKIAWLTKMSREKHFWQNRCFGNVLNRWLQQSLFQVVTSNHLEQFVKLASRFLEIAGTCNVAPAVLSLIASIEIIFGMVSSWCLILVLFLCSVASITALFSFVVITKKCRNGAKANCLFFLKCKMQKSNQLSSWNWWTEWVLSVFDLWNSLFVFWKQGCRNVICAKPKQKKQILTILSSDFDNNELTLH